MDRWAIFNRLLPGLIRELLGTIGQAPSCLTFGAAAGIPLPCRMVVAFSFQRDDAGRHFDD